MAQPIKVVVHGAAGKMGREVLNAVCHAADLKPVGAVDKLVGAGELTLPHGCGPIPFSSDLAEIIKLTKPDVLVDFTTASAALPAVRTAIQMGVRPVVGTTGLSESDIQDIEKLCQVKKIGAFLAPNFSLGAVMLTTRRQLDQIGGFEVLADFLADDYQLGHRIAGQGGSIVLSSIVVECRSTPMNWREVWNHQLRWACTIRACKPLPYALSIVSNATLWPLLWLACAPTPAVLLWVGLCLMSRLAVAVGLQRRLTRSPLAPVWWPLAWIKDGLQCVLWAASFVISRVDWRGERYQLLTGGKLRKVRS